MFDKVTILGRVGRDCEAHYTDKGDLVATFSVAATRYHTAGGEKTQSTIWYRVSAWGKLAEFVQSAAVKGAVVLVEGQLTCDPVTGGPKIFQRRDGSSGASFEVRADTFRVASRQQANEAEAEAAPTVVGEADFPF